MSDVGVEGNSNRVSGRDFQETSISHSNVIIGSLPERELLTELQRKRLNQLVSDISREYSVGGGLIWKKVVHAQIGVRSIDEILRSQFAVVEGLLEEYAEELHAQAHVRRLVPEVQQAANQRGVYQELLRFCSREFGIEVLNKLNPEQLKASLHFVESCPQRIEQFKAAEPLGAAGWLSQMWSLWSQYPGHMGVVVVIAAIAGRIVF